MSSARLAEERWLEAEAVTDPAFADYWYFRDLRGQAPLARSNAGTVEEWLAEVAVRAGANVVPSGMAEQYRRPGLAFVPVSEAPPSRLVLAWRRDGASEVTETLARFAAGHQQPRS